MNPLEPISSIMTRDVIGVQQDASLSTVRQLLKQHAIHHVPVLNGDVLVGILSSIDLAMLALDAYIDDEETTSAHMDAAFTIQRVMSLEPIALHPGDPIQRAADILGDGEVHSLPIVDDAGCLVGIVTSTDLIRHLARQYR